MNRLAGMSAAVMLMAASGCFGGGGDRDDTVVQPPPPPPAGGSVGGIWTGALVWEHNGLPGTGSSLNVRGLIAETGEFSWVLADQPEQFFGDQSQQLFGALAVSGTEVRSSRAVWSAASDSANPTGNLWGVTGLVGQREVRVGFSGVFRSSWPNLEDRTGAFTLNYHSLYERESSLTTLRGTFSTATEMLAIDDQGVIFYQSSGSGCTGNGTAEVIDPDFNMYRMEVAVENCMGIDAVRNGLTFTGLAYLGVNNEPGGGFLNETIEMALNGWGEDDFGRTQIVIWTLLAHRR